MAKMRAGGNGKLRAFWTSQKFSLNTLGQQEKYENEAMSAYRENITLEAQDKPVKPVPLIGFKSTARAKPHHQQHQQQHRSNSAPPGRALQGRGNTRPKMQGFGGGGPSAAHSRHAGASQQDMFADFSSAFFSVTEKIASGSKTAAAAIKQKSQHVASAVQADLQSESGLSSSVASQAASGWSALASFVTNTIDTIAKPDEPITLYGKEPHSAPNPQGHRRQDKNAMPSLSSDAFFAGNGSSSSSASRPARKKMASLSSDAFFQEQLEQSSPPRKIGTGKKMASLSSTDFFNSNKQSPPPRKIGTGKKMASLSSADFFNAESPSPSRESLSSPTSKSRPTKSLVEESSVSGDADGFGGWGDAEDVTATTGVHEKKAKPAQAVDETMFDGDDWGW